MGAECTQRGTFGSERGQGEVPLVYSAAAIPEAREQLSSTVY